VINKFLVSTTHKHKRNFITERTLFRHGDAEDHESGGYGKIGENGTNDYQVDAWCSLKDILLPNSRLGIECITEVVRRRRVRWFSHVDTCHGLLQICVRCARVYRSTRHTRCDKQ